MEAQMGPLKNVMDNRENSLAPPLLGSPKSKSGSPVSTSTAESEALSNHLVLTQILHFLETKFLLEVSLVSKLWCQSARSVLRNHRKCLAQLTGRNPCMELFQLNKVLFKSQENPYSGLIFRTGQKRTVPDREFPPNSQTIKHKCIYTSAIIKEPSCSSQIDHNSFPYATILEKLTLRHLEIYWDTEYTCPAQGLLQKIVTEKRKELVELKILCFPDTIPSIIEYLGIKSKDWLPNLKILDFNPECEKVWNVDSQRVLKYDLIKASPRLEEQLGISDHYDLQYFLDNNKVHVMKHFCITKQDFFDVRSNNRLNRLLKFGSAGPKLTKILIDGYIQ